MADDDQRNFIIFSNSKSLLQASLGWEWTLLLSLGYLNAFLASTAPWESYFTGFPVMSASGVIRRRMLQAYWEELEIFQFHMVILKSTSMTFCNANGSLSGMKQLPTNYMKFFLSWLYGLGVFSIIRREESVLGRIQIGHTHLTHSLLLEEEDPT